MIVRGASSIFGSCSQSFECSRPLNAFVVELQRLRFSVSSISRLLLANFAQRRRASVSRNNSKWNWRLLVAQSCCFVVFVLFCFWFVLFFVFKKTEARLQVLANLANFSYDPVNYESLARLGVPALFLGEHTHTHTHTKKKRCWLHVTSTRLHLGS